MGSHFSKSPVQESGQDKQSNKCKHRPSVDTKTPCVQHGKIPNNAAKPSISSRSTASPTTPATTVAELQNGNDDQQSRLRVMQLRKCVPIQETKPAAEQHPLSPAKSSKGKDDHSDNPREQQL